MDTNGLYPIYDMWYIPFWQTKGFYTAVVVASVAVLAVVVWYGLKKYRASKRKRKLPWDVALNELGTIEKDLSQKGMLGKTFYFRLSWVFKRYLNERYGFEVYGKTDKELIMYLEGTGLSLDLIQDLKVIFEGIGVIKFANQEAVKERINRDLSMSVALIKRTIPTPEN